LMAAQAVVDACLHVDVLMVHCEFLRSEMLHRERRPIQVVPLCNKL
jgi:hypothetical protein